LRKLYPELRQDGGKLHIIDDLKQLDLKPLMDEITSYNEKNDNCFGYLPSLMVNSSKCQLGALLL